MKLTNKQLLGLTVVTQSGQVVGQVVGFELDNESHLLVNYYVSGSPWVTRLVGINGKALIIARTQVISMDAERMVVYDNVVSEKKAGAAALAQRVRVKAAASATAPAAVGAATSTSTTTVSPSLE